MSVEVSEGTATYVFLNRTPPCGYRFLEFVLGHAVHPIPCLIAVSLAPSLLPVGGLGLGDGQHIHPQPETTVIELMLEVYPWVDTEIRKCME
jgi:hypothetical protein